MFMILLGCSGGPLGEDPITDADGDGYAPCEEAEQPCDCDDEDAGVNPGQAEIGCNGIDDDCSGDEDLPGGVAWVGDVQYDSLTEAAEAVLLGGDCASARTATRSPSPSGRATTATW